VISNIPWPSLGESVLLPLGEDVVLEPARLVGVRATTTVLLVVALAVTACAESDRPTDSAVVNSSEGEREVFLSRELPRDGERVWLAARLEGTVEIVNGCVRIKGEELVWPAGYTARRADDGEYEILDDRGSSIARSGDTVVMGGGEVTFRDFESDWKLFMEIDDRCAKGLDHVWLTGRVTAVNAASR
jgi:hypothetical protein